MAISVPSTSVWDRHRGSSIASNSDPICAVSTRWTSSRFWRWSARRWAPAASGECCSIIIGRRAGDYPPPVLIAFYKAIGALILARIAILHLQETPVRDPAKWPKRAAEYLKIARRECRHLDL